MDFLRSLWSPVANVAGAVAAGIGLHLWTRFRGRLITLPWTAHVQAFSQSAADAQHGEVQVLYNGEPAEHVCVATVRVTNDSSRDVENLELQVGVRDGSVCLSHTAQIEGSLRLLLPPDHCSQFATRVLATPMEQRNPIEVRDLTQNRFFHVPALNRQGSLQLGLLLHAPMGIIPKVLLSTQHKGITLREELPRPQVWGVRSDYVGWIGFGFGLLIVLALGWTDRIPLGTTLASFMLGALALVIGALLVKVWRLLVRVLG